MLKINKILGSELNIHLIFTNKNYESMFLFVKLLIPIKNILMLDFNELGYLHELIKQFSKAKIIKV